MVHLLSMHFYERHKYVIECLGLECTHDFTSKYKCAPCCCCRRPNETCNYRPKWEREKEREKEVLVAQGASSRQLGPLGVDWKITCVNNMLFNILVGMRESTFILCRLGFSLTLFPNAMAKKGFTRLLFHSPAWDILSCFDVAAAIWHIYLLPCMDDDASTDEKQNPVFNWRKYCAQYPLSLSLWMTRYQPLYLRSRLISMACQKGNRKQSRTKSNEQTCENHVLICSVTPSI